MELNGNPTPTPPGGNLPQTGMDITPVAVLFGAGMAFVLIGFILILSKEKPGK